MEGVGHGRVARPLHEAFEAKGRRKRVETEYLTSSN